MSDPVHIFGLPFSSFVRSVMLCCEEINREENNNESNLKYTVGLSMADKTIELKSEEHFELHPFGKYPVLIDGSNKIFETASICRYLDEKFGNSLLQSTELNEKTTIDQWSAAIASYVDKTLVRDYLLEFAFPRGKEGRIRMEVIAEVEPQVVNILEKLELLLADKEFICSKQYSIADALLLPILDYLFFLPVSDKLFNSTPALKSYIQRMQKRPSSIKVLTHKTQ